MGDLMPEPTYVGDDLPVLGKITNVISDPALLHTFRQAAAFDRMAAIQLRRIAVMEPHLADRLRHIANQLEADAADMERHLSDN
jgi:hypothetical protein